MERDIRSWIMWSAGLAAVAAGAWMLRDDQPAAETTSGGAGTARPLPAAPTSALGPPVATMVSSSNASAAAATVNTDRFKLVGIVTLDGVKAAMIAVRGQQPRMFRVGELLDGNLLLREIAASRVVIASPDGEAAIALDNATPPSSATASLESGGPPVRNLSDGSVEAQQALRRMGARNAPMKPHTAAEQASAAQASVPTDPGRWQGPGQP